MSAAPCAAWRRDVAAIVRIGSPLIVTNVFSIGVAVADTLMAASLGPGALAAVAIGSGVWIALFLLGLGTVMALGPTVAQHYGAGQHARIGADTRQGLWLALLVALPVIVAMRSSTPLLRWVGIDEAVIAPAQGYLDLLSWGVPAAYAYHAFKQMNEGVGSTVPIMTVMALALPLNVALNYAFLFGRLGAPALGAPGCGLGNAIAFWIMLAMLAFHTLRAPRYRRFEIVTRWDWPQRATQRRLLVLGVPIGCSLFLQSGLFTTVALLMGALGTVAVAAHQVVLNYSGLVFMVPLGFGMALTVCVGQAVGRGDLASAARIGYTGMALCGALSLLAGLTTLLLAGRIAALYTADAAVARLAGELFRIAAFLQIGDGVQVAAAFALRGLKDTRVPLLLNAFNYWGIGFVLAWLLGIELGYGAHGIWAGLAVALCTAGVLLIARFRWLTSCRPRTPPVGPAAVAAGELA
ncbi:MAG: MATE family efflux transporter [Gammaproteobacteria bacterium]|nr:MATE family efflux transporter [Gammaproteobacteria bacterium]MCP5201347.1 MATE family efflux transporter [Gammaproteobacteria bacterium]